MPDPSPPVPCFDDRGGAPAGGADACAGAGPGGGGYRYSLCGVSLASDIPLPELPELPLGAGAEATAAPAAVTVRLGTVPDVLPGCLHRGVALQVADGGVCRFAVPGVAAFLIEGGQRITVQPFMPPQAPDIRVFLLGSVFGILCHQRGWLPLHACSVMIDGAAVVFTGPSGMGKSTLAATFLQQGYRLLADDVTVIDAGAPGGPQVLPSIGRIRLWRETLLALKIPLEGVQPCRDRLDKFQIAVSGALVGQPLPLAALHHLDRVADPRLAGLVPVSGREGLEALLGAVYRRRVAERMGKGGQILRGVQRLLDRPNLILRYPSGLARLPQAVEEMARRYAGGQA